MSVAGAFAEFSAWVEPALAGWRYVWSPTYRAQKHRDWGHEHLGFAIVDVVGGIVGIVISVAVVWIVVAIAWFWAFNEM